MALKGKEKANIEERLYAKLKQNAYNERIRKRWRDATLWGGETGSKGQQVPTP